MISVLAGAPACTTEPIQDPPAVEEEEPDPVPRTRCPDAAVSPDVRTPNAAAQTGTPSATRDASGGSPDALADGGTTPDDGSAGAPSSDGSPPVSVPMDVGYGGPSRCEGSGLPVCLDFENGLPAGWSGGVPAETGRAARGKKALHVTSGTISSSSVPAAAGPILWGRFFAYVDSIGTGHDIYIKVFGSGAPLAADRSFYGLGANAKGWNMNSYPDTVNVAIKDSKFHTGELVAECKTGKFCTAEQVQAALIPVGRWTCVEFEMDARGGVPLRVYRDGQAIFLSDYNRAYQWPRFDKLTRIVVGLAYSAGGSKYWMDELALDGKRIGCER